MQSSAVMLSDNLFVHRDSPEDNPSIPFDFTAENQKVSTSRHNVQSKIFLLIFLFLAAYEGDFKHLPGRTQTGRYDSVTGFGSTSTWLASDFGYAQSGGGLRSTQHACLRSGHFLYNVYEVILDDRDVKVSR